MAGVSNGAGKSTLMKIIAGVHAEYLGVMRLNGAEVVHFRSARDARDAGVGMVHQELSIMTRSQRGRERVPWQSAHEPPRSGGLAAHGARGRLVSPGPRHRGLHLRAPMASLPIGMQQLVELSRVLFSGARIIILDQPTSALSAPEVDRLFAVLRRLRESGKKHRLHLGFPR